MIPAPAPPCRDKLPALPDQPGVYLMKDKDDAIIYIGKASSLKKRVSSYFSRGDHDPKTRVLVKNIHDLDFIVTDSEIEALLLENSLIKKHLPKFNIRLKDDKRYPYIAISREDDFPRVLFTRSMAAGQRDYFGPYTDARAARSIIDTINRIFRLKSCSREVPLAKGERPCLNHQMGRCLGPCVGSIGAEEYRSIIDHVAEFLRGDIDHLVESLRVRMEELSARLEFEKAARLRDIIHDIKRFSESQKVYETQGGDTDYAAVAISGSEAIALIFEYRSGALIGKKIFLYQNSEYANPGEILKTCIVEHYATIAPPARIVAQCRIEDKPIIERHLTAIASRRISITTPHTRDQRAIIALMQKNIEIIRVDRLAGRQAGDAATGLAELAKILGLADPPKTIECFDISNTQGTNAVASMVRFRDGRPDKSGYRRYRIRGYQGANDPGMIHEALSRRLQHLLNEGAALPQLIVIDGGKPQLGRALEAATALGAAVPIIALAKRLEEIYTGSPADPIRLPEGAPALKMLQNIRDEAHRFAITYHRLLRGKQIQESALDAIPDIGKRKKMLLLRHFGGIDGVRIAGIDELAAVPGIGPETAKKIIAYFHESEEEER